MADWEQLAKPRNLGDGRRAEYHYLSTDNKDTARVMIIGSDLETGRDYIERTEYIEHVLPEDISLISRLNIKAGLEPKVKAGAA